MNRVMWRAMWRVMCVLTFHHVDQRAHVALLDDAGVFPIIHRVHAVDDLVDLRQLQVLHEVVVQDGLFYHLLWPEGRKQGKDTRTGWHVKYCHLIGWDSLLRSEMQLFLLTGWTWASEIILIFSILNKINNFPCGQWNKWIMTPHY